jgi:hypothetical protein
MDACPEDKPASDIRGRLIRLGEGHAIAIFSRDKLSWVVEFENGRAELFDAATWFGFCAGTLRYSHVQRATALDSATTLTREVLEKVGQLHRNTRANYLDTDSGVVAALETLQRHCSDMASRVRELASRRSHGFR